MRAVISASSHGGRVMSAPKASSSTLGGRGNFLSSLRVCGPPARDAIRPSSVATPLHGLCWMAGWTIFRDSLSTNVSVASSLAWGSGCNGAINSVGFFVSYQRLFGNGACSNLRDGSSILAQDALLVFTQGVRNTKLERPSRDAVLAGITDISSAGPGALQGANDLIDYPRTGDQAVPKDKAILVLRGSALMAPRRMLLCGQLDTAQPPPDHNCPRQATP
jgi:hypothetical protein